MFKRVFALIISALFFPIPVYAVDTGELPVPIFTDAGIEAVASYDAASGLYSYSYTISNPATNSGEIGFIAIDIRRLRNSMVLSSAGLTIPFGARTLSFDEIVNIFDDHPPMVPVGIRMPSGLNGEGGLMMRGAASVYPDPLILPGQTQGGFELYSRGLPGIRDVEINPAWTFVGEATYESTRVAIEIEEQLKVRKKSIGPTAPPAASNGTFYMLAMFDIIGGYITETVNLGWLADTSLASSLSAKHNEVVQAMDARDPSLAKTKLGEFMTLLDQSSSAQRTSEAYGLLYFNAKYIQDRLPDTATSLPPPEIILDLAPIEAERTTGTVHTFTVTLTSDGEPIVGVGGGALFLKILSGPYLDYLGDWPFFPVFGSTDENGQVAINFSGARVEGTDRLVAQVRVDETLYTSDPVEVTWSGGPDLAIKLFSPPMIIAKGGAEITVTESTANKGNVAAGPSITRYYLSEDETIDPATDRVIGDRQVESLEPGMDSDGGERLFVLPSDLAEGTYYIWGCADADDAVTETYELNNCLKNQVVTQIAIPINRPTNQPPLCDQASSSVASLWPPFHELFPVSVVGVTDPDNDALTLTVTSITQDEPINYVADGDTEPDGFGIGTSEAQLRAERAGNRNGRVYAIQFSADDGKGGQCDGSVNVVVPHDEGEEALVVDDGQAYSSTQP